LFIVQLADMDSNASFSAAAAADACETFLRDFRNDPEGMLMLEELRSVSSVFDRDAIVPLVHNVVCDPQHALAITPQSTTAPARRHHMSMRINPELTTAITNSVHCTTLINMKTGEPYALPLDMLERVLAPVGAQFMREHFAKLVIRYGPPTHTTQLCFTTGKVLEPGKVAFETKRVLLYALVNMMREAGLNDIGVGTRACQNLVSTGLLAFPVRLRLLKQRYSESDYVMYDPDLFPGAIIRHPLLVDTVLAADDDNRSAQGVDDELYWEDGDEIPEDGKKADLLKRSDPADYIYPGPRDCNADEILDDPEAERAATDYVRALLAHHGGNTNDPDRIRALADARLGAQAKKNIVALVFGVGVIIIGGAKNVRMMRRAQALVFEMVTHCRDTPENRALEAETLRAAGLPVPPEHTLAVSAPRVKAAKNPAGRGRKRGATWAANGDTRKERKRAKKATVAVSTVRIEEQVDEPIVLYDLDD
jgi:TATA-box binding protein (TBP) (component of TFIID and TFIIIB)